MIFISHMGTTFADGETAQGSGLLRQFNQKMIAEERAAAEEEKRIIEEMRHEYRESHTEYFKENGESILKNHMKPKNRKK